MDLRTLWVFLTHAASYGVAFGGLISLIAAVTYMEWSDNVAEREKGQALLYALTAVIGLVALGLFAVAGWLSFRLRGEPVPLVVRILRWLLLPIATVLILVPVVQHEMGLHSGTSAFIAALVVPYLGSLWVLTIIPSICNCQGSTGERHVTKNSEVLLSIPPRL